MIYRIYEFPMWAIGASILALFLLAMEVGAWNGARLTRRLGEAKGGKAAGRGDLEVGALLALMGLVLAFTYSFSLSRFDLRKQALVHEANAIGTAFLRADLLPEPGRTELRERLLDYARTRIVSDEARKSLAATQADIAASLAAQARLWPTLEQALDTEVPGQIQILLVQSVNEVIDANTTRLAVGFDRLAPSVFFFMVAIAMLAVAFSAQNGSKEGKFSRGRISVFALALSGLIFIIVDFDNSSRGLIRLNEDSLTMLVRDMEAEMGR